MTGSQKEICTRFTCVVCADLQGLVHSAAGRVAMAGLPGGAVEVLLKALLRPLMHTKVVQLPMELHISH